MFKLQDEYASYLFTDSAMKKYLPDETYKQLRSTIEEGKPLAKGLADTVANGMKDWAIDNGATHFTHWFQPMTGYTAEKHDSFINPQSDGGVILSFSGNELSRGESDASSFPSGGLRATFEARGYTTWDCTSPAFIKDHTLYIPTCFCSFTGESLDKKTPLLRSMSVISKNALRVLRALGDTKTQKVVSMAGAEQEYFLIDKETASKRLDIITCGRTLFGARPPKGQELDDHYYGNIDEKILKFMREVDHELWRLGVPAKTEHNEVAPAQHELASVYSSVNISCDQNQLVMETLKKTALRHGLFCLLHEKPFAGVNGSGKHNNWSIAADGEESLFSQGSTPEENERFLVMLAAVIWAVDEYAGLLCASVASAGNDCRLGGNEAPPTVMSVFLGDMLTDVLGEIQSGGKSVFREGGSIKVGVTGIPKLPRDISDRNRTSPFAFTGKKFEFRMLGSSASIADCNTVINTAVGDVLGKIADRLEKAEDKNEEAHEIIREVMKKHGKIIFNGNNYSKEWAKEAEERGLVNMGDAVEAAAQIIATPAVELFEKYGIFTRKELEARYEIRLENYSKRCKIESETLLCILKRSIIPAVIEYAGVLAKNINEIRQTAIAVDISIQAAQLKEISSLLAALKRSSHALGKAVAAAQNEGIEYTRAHAYRDKV
ncbi:MAG: glutamine synthetase III, partial [Clostridia bacterium]|nr:glutamine synthetase III [Clostridia bacterium]